MITESPVSTVGTPPTRPIRRGLGRCLAGLVAVAVAAASAALAAQPAASATAIQPAGPPGSWTLGFADDFTGTQLDTTRWRPNRSGGSGADGPFNPSVEGAAFRSSNVSVQDGSLVFTIKAEPTTVGGRTYPLTSGTVSSEGHYALKDGDYVEARIFVPAGDGLWPAFWACTPNAWPPEIDGFEFFNTANQSAPRFNYHPPAGGQSGPSKYGEATTDYRNSWHTYGWLRTGGKLTPFLDGVPYPQAGATGVDARDYFIILNMSVYSGHTPAVGPGSSQMKIDWVRAWRPGSALPATSTSSSPSSPPASSSAAPSTSTVAPPTGTPTSAPPTSTPVTTATSTSSPVTTSTARPVAPQVSLRGSSVQQSAVPVGAMVINRPAGTRPDDLLIASFTVDHLPAVTPPAGWSVLAPAQRLGTGATVLSYYRRATAGDPASWSWQLNSPQKWGGGITAFAGVDADTPFAGVPVAANDSTYKSNRLVLPGVVTTGPSAMIVTGYGSDSRDPSPTPPTGFTTAWNSTGGQAASVATRLQANPGPSGTQTWTLPATRAVGGWMVALKAAAS